MARSEQRGLGPALRVRLEGVYAVRVLERVRVVERPPPVPWVVTWMGRRRPSLVAHGPIGITLGWVVFVHPSYATDDRLMFHELVHVVQWEAVGRLRFLLLYMDGVLRWGYRDCPLEAMAYALTDGYVAGSGDDAVEALVREQMVALGAGLRSRGWLARGAWWLAGAW